DPPSRTAETFHVPDRHTEYVRGGGDQALVEAAGRALSNGRRHVARVGTDRKVQRGDGGVGPGRGGGIWAMEVEAPSCHTMLRPPEKRRGEGGENPCQSCGTILGLDVPMWMPAEPAPPPARRPRRSRKAGGVPIWVWLAGGG